MTVTIWTLFIVLSFIQNLIGLCVPHRRHVTSPLQAQEVNVISRFVRTVYFYNYHDSGYYSSSCLLFKPNSTLTHYVSATSPTD
jgi:hypothetical protein